MVKITGEEDYVYVWTLGVEGAGDGSDKLVTVDVRKGSPTFGKVIGSASVGGRHEAHHGGFTDDRRHFWAAGLSDSRIFIFDVAADPANPKLVKTIEDFVQKSGGAAGPHGAYALPGRMLIPSLSNKDGTGKAALVEYSNDGDYIITHWLPTDQEPKGAKVEKVADGYGYDARVLPRKNIMLSSSFTGIENYMRPLGEVVKDSEAMKKFGQTMVLWDFHARQPKQVLHVPGVPLEIRWAWGPHNNYAFTSTALTGKIWLVYEDQGGEWKAQEVADIGDPSKLLVPVDISLSADDKTLFVDTFMDGTTRAFDVSDPHKPKQIYEKRIGAQLNMVSQSWDGKRVYYTSSLLANWDKTGADNEQFLKAYTWDGKELAPRFEIDFTAEKLGRPHMMAFGSAALYAK
jgi:selenium-binding protein 1